MRGATQPKESSDTSWWQRRWLVVAALIFAALPLLYPQVPPLVDLLGHMGRYAVLADGGQSPLLARYFGYHWAPIGNLGVDALVVWLTPLLGLEPAIKWTVLAIPVLTVAGFLWVAREVHGRLPPLALATVPLALGHPFLFGFVNYALSMALAFLAFGLWLRLGRRGRTRLRTLLFVPISFIVYFAHTFGWGVLGLMVFADQWVRRRDAGAGWVAAAFQAAPAALLLAGPLLIAIAAPGGLSGETFDWFKFDLKALWLASTLRDRWQAFDLLSLAALVGLFVIAVRQPSLRLSRRLLILALLLAATFLLLPRILVSSAFADMRLTPFILALLLLAVGPRPGESGKASSKLAAASLLFMVVRIAGTTLSLGMAADDQARKLAVVAKIPEGARVATLVLWDCNAVWPLLRNTHLGSFVIARRQGFANDQWAMAGLNLLDIRYTAPGAFGYDPAELVRPNGCHDGTNRTVDEALRDLPRDAFDYVWLIDVDQVDPVAAKGLLPTPPWPGSLPYQPGSLLYRVDRPS